MVDRTPRRAWIREFLPVGGHMVYGRGLLSNSARGPPRGLDAWGRQWSVGHDARLVLVGVVRWADPTVREPALAFRPRRRALAGT